MLHSLVDSADIIGTGILPIPQPEKSAFFTVIIISLFL